MGSATEQMQSREGAAQEAMRSRRDRTKAVFRNESNVAVSPAGGEYRNYGFVVRKRTERPQAKAVVLVYEDRISFFFYRQKQREEALVRAGSVVVKEGDFEQAASTVLRDIEAELEIK